MKIKASLRRSQFCLKNSRNLNNILTNLIEILGNLDYIGEALLVAFLKNLESISTIKKYLNTPIIKFFENKND